MNSQNEKKDFFQFPNDNLGNSPLRGCFFSMNNKFINNNGVNLLHMSKKPVKKTKVESQIELLKQQEHEIILLPN